MPMRAVELSSSAGRLALSGREMAVLTDEREMMVDLARRVGQRWGLDYWLDQDRKKQFPADAWREICRAGLGSCS